MYKNDIKDIKMVERKQHDHISPLTLFLLKNMQHVRRRGYEKNI